MWGIAPKIRPLSHHQSTAACPRLMGNDAALCALTLTVQTNFGWVGVEKFFLSKGLAREVYHYKVEYEYN